MTIRMSTKPCTLPRMRRHIKLLGLTGEQHALWTGFDLKAYLKENPGWLEVDWVMLVKENLEVIRKLWDEENRRLEILRLSKMGPTSNLEGQTLSV